MRRKNIVVMINKAIKNSQLNTRSIQLDMPGN